MHIRDFVIVPQRRELRRLFQENLYSATHISILVLLFSNGTVGYSTEFERAKPFLSTPVEYSFMIKVRYFEFSYLYQSLKAMLSLR